MTSFQVQRYQLLLEVKEIMSENAYYQKVKNNKAIAQYNKFDA